MQTQSDNNPEVLLLMLEFTPFSRGKQFTYSCNFAYEQAMLNIGYNCTTVPMIGGYNSDSPLSWLNRSRSWLEHKKFDQVWVWMVHTQFSDADLEWLHDVAPVRVGWIVESLSYTKQDAETMPHLVRRQEQVERQIPYLTHVLTVDEEDANVINAKGLAHALWMPNSIPKDTIASEPSEKTNSKAAFYGSVYGERKKFVDSRQLRDYLALPGVSEANTNIPEQYDLAHKQGLEKLYYSPEVGPEDLRAFTDSLRDVRRWMFDDWLGTISKWQGIVNIPSIGKVYTSRVQESMAAGTCPISWEVPSRPRNRSLFKKDEEILLFDGNSPEQLAKCIKKLQDDPELANRISTNCLDVIRKHHTTEHRVKQINEWIETNIEPDYRECIDDGDQTAERRITNVDLKPAPIVKKPSGRTKEVQPTDQPVTIIVKIENDNSHLETCLNSLSEATHQPHALVLIDNATNYATKRLIADFASKRTNCIIIKSDKKLRAAECFNTGLANATTDLVCITDDKTLGTNGYLEKLVKAISFSHDLGIVYPVSASVRSSIRVPNADYDVETLDRFEEFIDNFNRNTPPYLSAGAQACEFFMLVKKPVVDKIGGFDDRLTTQNLMVKDYVARCLIAGFKPATVHNVFLHHFETESDLQTSEEDRNKSWTAFKDKWHLEQEYTLDDMHCELERILENTYDETVHCLKLTKSKNTYISDPNEPSEKHEARKELSKNNYEKAIELLTRIVDSRPQDADLLNMLATSYFGLGRLQEAKINAKLSLKHDPDSPSAHYTLALINRESGDIMEAAREACKTLELDEHHLESNKMIHSLREDIEKLAVIKPSKSNKRKNEKSENQKGVKKQQKDTVLRQIDRAITVASQKGSSHTTEKIVRKDGRPSLTLCMIAKDEEDFIDGALLSVKDIVDEIVIVDTGSTDRTKEIALSHGATIYDYPWTNDFSEARNHCIEHAHGDWILHLDADERIDKKSLPIIESSIKDKHIDACELLFHNYYSENPRPDLIHRSCRLHRNYKAYRFENAIHENISFSVVRSGGKCSRKDIIVHHYGYNPTVVQAKGKNEKYIHLMTEELKRKPDDQYTMFHLSAGYCTQHKYQEAVPILEKLAEIVDSRYTFAPNVFSRLANAYWMLDRNEDAVNAIELGNKRGFKHPEMEFARANALRHAEKHEEAIDAYFKTLDMIDEFDKSLGDPGIFGYKSYYGLSASYAQINDTDNAKKYGLMTVEEQPNHEYANHILAQIFESEGDLDNAERHWLSVRDSRGHMDAESRRALAKIYTRQERLEDATAELKHVVEVIEQSADDFFQMGVLAEMSDNTDSAKNWYGKAIDADNKGVGAYNNLARILAAEGNTAQALELLDTASNADPDCANTNFIAGDILYQMGQFQDAANVYEDGLAIEGNHASGHFVLGNCYFQLGQYDKAVDAYEKAIGLAPDYEQAQNNLSLAKEALTESKNAA